MENPNKKRNEISRPVVTMIPELFPGPDAAEALKALRGKGNDPGQKAVLRLIRLTREDVLNAMTLVDLPENQVRFLQGQAHVLKELEREMVVAHTTPME